MTETIKNIADYKELYAQYNWFSGSYPAAIQQAFDDFFLPGLNLILLGISKNINSLMDKEAYFVTKVCIDKQHDMFFRTSEKAAEIILEKALGKANSRFNLNKLTDLEAKIITAFNDFMYNSISSNFSPAPPTLKRMNFDVIHLTFILHNVKKGESAKFIVTLPDVLLNPDTIESTGDKFSYADFSTSIIEAAVKIGTTKIKLIDVKNIDIDDIVVFDNSDTKRMILKFKDYEKDINLNPNLGLVLPYDYDEGEADMADENNNLWDTIEVEMAAQFDTVKVTLGELKNIEEGLVVDLTSIYDNKVTLSVENKPIARGELVIVNDRYGVKIEEVIAGGKSPQQTASEPIQETEEEYLGEDENLVQEKQEEIPQETQDEEDEFDYSDFELEDEDI